MAGGALISVQGRMNGELSAVWGVPLEAALWSFGSGFAVLCVLVALLPTLRRGLRGVREAVRAGRIRWWQCLGGALGALFVAAQTYAVPLVGVAVFTVALVAGQTTSGLLVDRVGLSPSGRVAVRGARLLAAGLAVTGAAIASSARSGSGTGAASATGSALVPALVAAAVGITFGVQLAINGHVNLHTRQPLSTTWLNFGTGVLMLGALTGARLLLPGSALAWSAAPAPWWAWFGGLCGIGGVVVASATVRVLGVLLLAIATLTGQLGGALLLDLATAAGRAQVGPQLVAGVLVTFAAAALAGLSR